MGKHRENRPIESIEYNPQNVEDVLQKFSDLNKYINSLETLLQAAESKTQQYEDKLLKYERIFKEEMDLYRLHRSNISVLNQTLGENEVYVNELQDQIKSFLDTQKNITKYAKQVTPFKRIFTRFFHQNKLYKYRVAERLTELNETIDKKNRLIERMHGEIQNWNPKNAHRLVPTQQLSVKQAFG